MEINEATLGPHHSSTAKSLHNQAQLHRAIGDHKTAPPLSTRAMEISEVALCPHHPETVLYGGNLTEASTGPPLMSSNRPSKRNLARAHGKYPMLMLMSGPTGPVVTADDVEAADCARVNLLAELVFEEINTKTKIREGNPKKKGKKKGGK